MLPAGHAERPRCDAGPAQWGSAGSTHQTRALLELFSTVKDRWISSTCRAVGSAGRHAGRRIGARAAQTAAGSRQHAQPRPGGARLPAGAHRVLLGVHQQDLPDVVRVHQEQEHHVLVCARGQGRQGRDRRVWRTDGVPACQARLPAALLPCGSQVVRMELPKTKLKPRKSDATARVQRAACRPGLDLSCLGQKSCAAKPRAVRAPTGRLTLLPGPGFSLLLTAGPGLEHVHVEDDEVQEAHEHVQHNANHLTGAGGGRRAQVHGPAAQCAAPRPQPAGSADTAMIRGARPTPRRTVSSLPTIVLASFSEAARLRRSTNTLAMAAQHSWGRGLAGGAPFTQKGACNPPCTVGGATNRNWLHYYGVIITTPYGVERNPSHSCDAQR